jgi:hypothetical protein
MALLAEELVEEWLRRQGFFTIRGAKLGVHEMDLLAVRMTAGGIACRHIEVQASINPQNYISHLTKDIQTRDGKKASSRVSRTEETLLSCVKAWVEKKYRSSKKQALLASLVPPSLSQIPWTRELVINKYKFQREIELIREQGAQIRLLSEIISELQSSKMLLESAAGGDFVNLVNLVPTRVTTNFFSDLECPD